MPTLGGNADDDVEGYGIRGANLLRRGNTSSCKPAVHMINAHCKSHRLQVRSSYPAETLAGARNLEDCYPTIFTRHELHAGPLTPTQLKCILELCGLGIKVTLNIDAASVFQSLASKDAKRPAECTLLGHISWLRQMMERGIAHGIQWCDTRDMSAD
eukprot:6102717-Pyramimonas_sp.AAC.1